MSTTLRLGLGVALALGLFACSSSPDDTASGEDDLKSAPTAKQIEELFAAVDENCAGNNNGSLHTFEVAKFKAADALNLLRAEDKNAMGSDCSDQHALSSSRESGVKLFEDHINDKLESTKSCLKKNLSTTQRTRLKQLVSDPTNLGVFSSVYSGGDNSEGCSYYNFHIYRRDGTLMELTFNFTD